MKHNVIGSPFLLYTTKFLSFLFHLVKGVTGKPSLQSLPSSTIAPFPRVLTRMLINPLSQGCTHIKRTLPYPSVFSYSS